MYSEDIYMCVCVCIICQWLTFFKTIFRVSMWCYVLFQKLTNKKFLIFWFAKQKKKKKKKKSNPRIGFYGNYNRYRKQNNIIS